MRVAAFSLGYSADRLSFETDQRPEHLHDAFPGDTLTKLRQLKARYDPDNFFNQNLPIPPTPHDEPAPSASQYFA